jgi:nucleoid-associated protein YgaU
VKKGDTLWRISVRMYGPGEHAGHQWTRIAKANHIHGTVIRPGQVLRIPR